MERKIPLEEKDMPSQLVRADAAQRYAEAEKLKEVRALPDEEKAFFDDAYRHLEKLERENKVEHHWHSWVTYILSFINTKKKEGEAPTLTEFENQPDHIRYTWVEKPRG